MDSSSTVPAESTETPILFWKPTGVNGWMSNWSAHPFKENGITFSTAEHWLMYQKAMTMGDARSAELILEARTPSGAKELGRDVKPWDEAKWRAVRFGIMCFGLKLKLEQNPTLLPLLAQTENRIIAEATPYDLTWGIGYSKDHPAALDPSKWRGASLLGMAWMCVRADFLRA